MDDYHRPPQQSVLQHERPEKGDWIAWNWRTASWDIKKEKIIASDGETALPPRLEKEG